MERVAEKAMSLSDTPSVEPYEARHPMRFNVTTTQILTCVMLCVVCALALVAWQSARSDREKKAMEGVSASYISAAESGLKNPMQTLDRADSLLADSWLADYQVFLDTWQALHFEGSNRPRLSSDSVDFNKDFSARHAAYVSQEVAAGHGAQVLERMESTRACAWRDHPYFKTWSDAQIDEASGNYSLAFDRYGKLLRSPLAQFALPQLGFIAIQTDETNAVMRDAFLKKMAQYKSDHGQSERDDRAVPGMALCAQAILERDKTGVSVPYIAHLRAPYDDYCAMGRIFSGIANGSFGSTLNDMRDLEKIKAANMSGAAEASRIDAIVLAELHLHHTDIAVSFYKKLAQPDLHPQRIRLQNAILDSAVAYGDWSRLRELASFVPRDVSIFGAARVMDTMRARSPERPGASESLLRYGGNDAVTTASNLDFIYDQAASGELSQAFETARAIRHAHPDRLEPFLLQTLILSHDGKNKEAAFLIERAVKSGMKSLPLIVMANVYRARARMQLTPEAFILPFVSFDDRVLESARCEIFWRYGDPRARQCIQKLAMRPGIPAKSGWIMAHLSAPNADPSGDPASWAKAQSGALSFPGFFLAYARILNKHADLRAAANLYARAILDDETTSRVDVVEELERAFTSKKKRYEGAKRFENLISCAEKKHLKPDILGAIYLSAARLYQPENANSQAKIYLMRALDLLGDRPDILSGFVTYYEAKDKPQNAARWRARLNRALNLNNAQDPALQRDASAQPPLLEDE